MKRIFRGFMAIKSVIVGTLILALWVDSYWKSDTLVRGDQTQYIQLTSAAGRVLVRFVHDGQPTRLRASWHRESSADLGEALREFPTDQSVWGRLGFAFAKERLAAPVNGMRVDIVMPLWLLFALAMPAAVLWLLRRPSNRSAPGAASAWCPHCCVQFNYACTQCPRCGGPVGVGAAFSAPSLRRK
jgi:hypothetical protein